MQNFKVIVVWFITIVISAGLFDLLPGITIAGKIMPIARENFDTKVYWEGSDWIKNGNHPYYKHEFNLAHLKYFKAKGQIPYTSETYPLLGIIYFSLPAIFTNQFEIYQALMFNWNALWLLLLMIGLNNILKLLNKNWTNLLFLLLPSFLYFTFNRYDIFPSALVIWSIYYLLTTKYNISFLLLSLSILTKIYPILLFPVYLIYLKERNIPWLKYFYLTCAIGIMGISVTIWWSGWWPATGPYIMHWLRTETSGSLILSLKLLINNENVFWFIKLLFKILTIIVPISLTFYLFTKKNWHLTEKELNTLTIISLILLAPAIFGFFYSNQWVIWFVPILLIVSTRPILISILIHDALNYLQFPILAISSHLFTPIYKWFIIISLVRSLVLIWIGAKITQLLIKK